MEHNFQEALLAQTFPMMSDFTGETATASVMPIELNRLTPMKEQPRQNFSQESLEELAQSIRAYGVLQPLIVADNGDGRFSIIAGERRWRAAWLAGCSTVPCIVRPVDEHSNLELALIENIQREELSPVEEARTLARLIADHDYTQEALAAKIGKERSTITNSLRILALPDEILQDIDRRLLSAGHARALCGLEEKKQQLKARQTIHDKKLSVRQTEELVRAMKKNQDEPKKLRNDIPPDLRHLCDQFKGHLGTKVKISGDTEKGKIEISYYTPEDLDRIAELVLGDPLDSALNPR